MNHEAGTRILVEFDDRAVSLAGATEAGSAGTGSRNEGVHMLSAIDVQAQPLSAPQPQPEVGVLVAKIESALEVIHAALAEIKRIQSPQSPPQPQSKAG
jgi:hypothetical protein